MNTAEHSNENEFRSLHCLTYREGRLINIHLKTHYITKWLLGMKLPVTVRNATVHLWSILKVDIETCVWGKKIKLFTVDLKTLETIERLFGKPASSEYAKWNKQER